MNNTAFVFPGQATHYVGMGKEIAETYREAMEIYDWACDLTGVDIKRLCFEGPEEIQRLTENNQPIIHTTSLAILNVLEKRYGLGGDATAGFSLGQYTALVYAGSLEFKDTVSLVKQRGIYMQNAVPVGKGKMLAILGLDREEIYKIVEECLPLGHIEPSNFNCPGQTIVAGYNAPVDKAAEMAAQRGAKTTYLAVSGPFHTVLLTEAGNQLAREFELRNIEAKSPKIRYADNVTGKFETENINELLRQHVFSPVRWEESMDTMLEAGIDTFIEVGSQNFITNLNIRCAEKHGIKANCINVRDLETLDNLLRFVEKQKLA
ncbi:MAG: ACP S-malonyltransferase [Bacillota bacterium]